MPTQLAPNVLSWASILDDNTRDQALALAELPFVPRVALMPDAHHGKGSSVGTVIPTVGAVIPAAVGVDIGCGMIAVETNYNQADIKDLDLSVLRKAIEGAIPLSPGNYNKTLDRFPGTAKKIGYLEELARIYGVDLDHSPHWRAQLGTLGGGNHFIELCLDERGRVWLFLHSGSRGVGNQIAQKHIRIAQERCKAKGIELADQDHAYLEDTEEEFHDYIGELDWAQAFARENRAEMMDRFVRVFAEWVDDDPQYVESSRINTHHNYTHPETHDGELVWLTRKGAVNAHKGVRGVIPGSMGTRSYVVRGKGNAEALCSAPHGAGRVLSRNAAKKKFTADDLRDRMAGIEYNRESAQALVDEIPDAYKPIDVVMEDAADLVEIEHELRQILNVKGPK
jgi:tRNA-splicing ligase RtcB